MNRIRTLLEDGTLDLSAIVWKEHPDPEEKRGNLHWVPKIVGAEDRYAIIWNTYFELIFLRFHLVKRFESFENDIKMNAITFYEQFYSGSKEVVNRVELLKLLTGRIQDWIRLMEPTDQAVPFLRKLFNYDSMVSSNGTKFSELISLLDINTCPYCGRSFIQTVKKKSNGSYIRTCQADHFYPKSEYPWLALSLRNLIPVCSTCNRIKGKIIEPFLYPYEEEMGQAYRFQTHPVTGLNYLTGTRGAEKEFEVSLEKTPAVKDVERINPGFSKRAENEINVLGLSELYTTHNSYVLNIFRQRWIFGEPYVQELLHAYPELFHDPSEVRSMLYLKSIDKESIGRNPLDKLTRDIDYEIDQLSCK